MPTWNVVADTEVARALLNDLLAKATSSGVERVAAKASAMMLAASHAAFAEHSDPRSGAAWAPPAAATLAGGDFRSLLSRTGQLEQAVRSGYALVPMGARAFISVSFAAHGGISAFGLAMIHSYGVTAKARRSNRATRRRPGQTLPARSFIGLAPGEVDELAEFAATQLGWERT